MNAVETVFYVLARKEWPADPSTEHYQGWIISGRSEFQARIETTGPPSEKFNHLYLKVTARLPVEVKWGDRLQIKLPGSDLPVRLKVVYPRAIQIKKIKKEERLITWLDRYAGSEASMLLALTEDEGIKGLRQPEIEAFCRLPSARLSQLAIDLEKESQLFILEFSPLFLLNRKSFDFLTGKIKNFVEDYQQRRPGETGVSIKKIKERFRLPKPVLLLALNRLLKDEQLEMRGEQVYLHGFEISLSREEDGIMIAIEKMLLEQKFSATSLQDLARKFKIHLSRLETMIDLLLQKRKIVQSREGFILHASWLEEIKEELAKRKRQGRKELTVGEFKKLTGLSRKYAIPLLEFLDEIGLTRRFGSKRLII
ncbi:MAG: SelB C-terminal domain-containing protein [Acidobacteriota bacterium]|nr:SelB C-terminal domain-containing protein [Acidobacteriota bacterium]